MEICNQKEILISSNMRLQFSVKIKKLIFFFIAMCLSLHTAIIKADENITVKPIIVEEHLSIGSYESFQKIKPTITEPQESSISPLKDDSSKRLVFVNKTFPSRKFIPSPNKEIEVTMPDKTIISGNGFTVWDSSTIRIGNVLVEVDKIKELKMEVDPVKKQRPPGFYGRTVGFYGFAISLFMVVISLISLSSPNIGCVGVFFFSGLALIGGILGLGFLIVGLIGLAKLGSYLKTFKGYDWSFEIVDI